MLWRIRPLNIHVSLWLPPRGRTKPGYYTVMVGRHALGNLQKHPDSRMTKHPWEALNRVNFKDNSLGMFGSVENAVEALLATENKDRCPFRVTLDTGSVGGRPFDFGHAYSLGDDEDRVHFLVQMNPKDGLYYVDAVIVSQTIGCSYDLEVRGPFDTYAEAGEAGVEIARNWLTPGGIQIDCIELEAIQDDLKPGKPG